MNEEAEAEVEPERTTAMPAAYHSLACASSDAAAGASQRRKAKPASLSLPQSPASCSEEFAYSPLSAFADHYPSTCSSTSSLSQEESPPPPPPPSSTSPLHRCSPLRHCGSPTFHASHSPLRSSLSLSLSMSSLQPEDRRHGRSSSSAVAAAVAARHRHPHHHSTLLSPSLSMSALTTSCSRPRSLMESILIAKMERASLAGYSLVNGYVSPGATKSLMRADSLGSTSSFTSTSSIGSDYCRCDDCLLGIVDLSVYSAQQVRHKKVKIPRHCLLSMALHIRY